jgi:hypothetical protein
MIFLNYLILLELECNEIDYYIYISSNDFFYFINYTSFFHTIN